MGRALSGRSPGPGGGGPGGPLQRAGEGDAAVCEVPAARLERGDLCAEEHRLINTKRSSLVWVTGFRLCSFLKLYTLKYIKSFCILF